MTLKDNIIRPFHLAFPVKDLDETEKSNKSHKSHMLKRKLNDVKIYYKDDLIDELELLSSENIEEVNKFTKLLRSINFLIWGDV